ncbi:MAG TPA: transglutaminase domain-containing protein, partial [Egibacteraceae bacterium]|nr:transglutaminase domain-containing protein [Egibacteraceae bacterium]
PWRLGVIDVYEENAWKLPPYDVERFVELQGPAAVPDAPTAPADGDVSATFTLRDLPGRALPTLAGAHRVELPEGAIVDYDPRTQTMRLPRHTGPDFTYTVTAAPPPTTQQLAEAPEAGRGLREFLQAPPAPPEVTALLSEVPGDSPYARLHVLRRALYEEVVAAGAGQPVDVPPHRVVEMLAGGEASPYEITAAEALLARWAGVPSRIGYGYFGGERADRRAPLSVRPEQGSTWLEGYFEGHGWVPLLGRPAQARSSLSDAQKREDPSVRPTDELAVITYVPVRLQTITLLFELVRHYTLQAIPVVLAVIMAIVFYPALLRLGRRARRTRWARRHGLPGRIAVTYANLRDAAWDFNVGHPTHTPLEFVNEVAYDAEHVELAWLVTRALWGDLARDLQHADVEAAEAMAASVHARLRAAQPLSSRLLAAASRASLREPYSRALPNMWLSWSLRRGLRRAGRSALLPLVAVLRLAGRGWRGVRRRLRIRPALSRAGLLVLAIALALSTACAPEQLDLTTTLNDSRLPQPAVPKRLDDLTFKREKSAEKAYREAGDDALVERGRVYSVNRDDVVEASLQVAQFKPGLFGRQDEVRDEITQSLGGGEFQPTRVRGEHVSMLETAEQRLYLWFSPDGTYYELFVARRAFEEAGEVFGALLAIQRGEAITSLDDSGDVGVADPRRGLVQ